jgi:ABC-type transport system substrate-binding protein
VRGLNPDKGDIWTQTYQANGMLVMTFGCPIQHREAAKPPDRVNEVGVKIASWSVSEVCKGHPTLDRRVRRALNLAIDKHALAKGPHFGFSKPIGSIYHAGSFGARAEVVNNVSPFDPEEAKRLLKEAGYEHGFTVTGHFGQFAGRPGIPETADFIASSWEKLGVKVTWQEHDPSDFVRGFRAGVFSWAPVALQTWGRQDHSGIKTLNYRSTSGYVGVYDDKSEKLAIEASNTFEPKKMAQKLAISTL